MTDHPQPRHDALVQLRKLIASLGAAPLPVPAGRDACDDCRNTAAVYAYGRVEVCARCWHRRDACRALAIKDPLGGSEIVS